jgi:hypothetical protein
MAQREQVLDRAQRLQQAFVNGTLRSTWLRAWSPREMGAAKTAPSFPWTCVRDITERKWVQEALRKSIRGAGDARPGAALSRNWWWKVLSGNELEIECLGFFFEPFDALKPELLFIILDAFFDVILSVAQHPID